MEVITKELVKSILPKRDADANKYSVGSLLCVVGSYGFAGAGVLSLRGALRSGVGFVRAVCPESIYGILSAGVPEAVFVPSAQTDRGRISRDNIGDIVKLSRKANSVLLGCGLGLCEDTEELVCALLNYVKAPVVLDADGINAVSSHIDVLKERKFPTVLTPHEGEMSRLTGLTSEYIRKNRQKAASEFAKEYGVTLVLKGKDTVIADESGKCFQNPTGNSGMAVAGSGDVLAGMIASFIAQGAGSFEGAISGVYLHGLSGDICWEEFSEYSLLPSDIVENIPNAIKEVIN